MWFVMDITIDISPFLALHLTLQLLSILSVLLMQISLLLPNHLYVFFLITKCEEKHVLYIFIQDLGSSTLFQDIKMLDSICQG